MAYYLSLDGVDDHVTCGASATFNAGTVYSIKAVVSFGGSLAARWHSIAGKDSWTAKTGWLLFYDNSANTTNKRLKFTVSGVTTNAETIQGPVFTPVANQFYIVEVISDGTTLTLKLDGTVIATATPPTIPDNTVPLYIGSRHGNAGTGNADRLTGGLRQVTLTKDGVTTGDWLFNTGTGTTVADSSGNGNTATLVGGPVWLDDAPTGGVTHPGSATMQGVSSATATATLTQSASVTANGVASTSIDASLIKSASSTMQGASTVTADASQTTQGSATMQGVATMTVSAGGVQPGSATMGGVATMSASGTLVQSSSASIQGVSAMSATSVLTSYANVTMPAIAQLSANGITILSASAVMSGGSSLIILSGKPIIGNIQLIGERTLYVYLVGSCEIVSVLRGDINLTTKNQNFEMYAGDTKNIVITVAGVDLAGASVKWAAKKTIFDAQPALYKDTMGGISMTDATAGKFTIALAPADTADLSGKYYHEAEVTDQSGNVSTVTAGTITINLSGV